MRAIGRRLFVQLSPASPVGQESLGLHPAGRDVARSAQPTAMAAEGLASGPKGLATCLLPRSVGRACRSLP